MITDVNYCYLRRLDLSLKKVNPREQMRAKKICSRYVYIWESRIINESIFKRKWYEFE